MNRGNPTATINILPTACYAAIDKINLWLPHPLSPAAAGRLERRCQSLHVLDRRMEFNRWYCQRLQLTQPTEAALNHLAQRARNALFNYVEIALDLIYADADQCQDAYEFLCRHHIKKHHGKQQVRLVGDNGSTRYSGPRRAPNVLCIYQGRHSKVSGEVNCLHVEWRIRSRQALRLPELKASMT